MGVANTSVKKIEPENLGGRARDLDAISVQNKTPQTRLESWDVC